MAADGPPHHHVSLNAAKWVGMRRDADLRRAVRSAGTVAADGAAVRWAAGAPERIPGIELAEELLAAAAARGWPVALVGGRSEVVARAAEVARARGARVALARDGYFAAGDEGAVVAAVNAARPRLLLLALGTPKAERFVGRWTQELRVPVVMGVGGAFDVWAGAARRAPRLVGALGLEWAWRFLGAPRARFERAVADSARFVVAGVRAERLPDDGPHPPIVTPTSVISRNW